MKDGFVYFLFFKCKLSSHNILDEQFMSSVLTMNHYSRVDNS